MEKGKKYTLKNVFIEYIGKVEQTDPKEVSFNNKINVIYSNGSLTTVYITDTTMRDIEKQYSLYLKNKAHDNEEKLQKNNDMIMKLITACGKEANENDKHKHRRLQINNNDTFISRIIVFEMIMLIVCVLLGLFIGTLAVQLYITLLIIGFAIMVTVGVFKEHKKNINNY